MMIRSVRFKRLSQYRSVIILSCLALCSFFTFISKQPTATNESPPSIPPNETRYERFCRVLHERIENENLSATPIHIGPQNGPIPYSYSQWRASPLMPRALTPCEHALYMHLVSILVEKIFTKHHIPYMMMAATLLGKYK